MESTKKEKKIILYVNELTLGKKPTANYKINLPKGLKLPSKIKMEILNNGR